MQIKMRLYWIRVDPSPITGVLKGEMQRYRTHRDGLKSLWRSCKPRVPGITGHPQELGEKQGPHLLWGPSEEPALPAS